MHTKMIQSHEKEIESLKNELSELKAPITIRERGDLIGYIKQRWIRSRPR